MPPKNPERQSFDVLPNPKGGWNVKREGSSRTLSHHPNKQQAMAAARERAKKAPLGQVRIHGMDGRIQQEWTYGKDPRRTPG